MADNDGGTKEQEIIDAATGAIRVTAGETAATVFQASFNLGKAGAEYVLDKSGVRDAVEREHLRDALKDAAREIQRPDTIGEKVRDAASHVGGAGEDVTGSGESTVGGGSDAVVVDAALASVDADQDAVIDAQLDTDAGGYVVEAESVDAPAPDAAEAT